MVPFIFVRFKVCYLKSKFCNNDNLKLFISFHMTSRVR